MCCYIKILCFVFFTCSHGNGWCFLKTICGFSPENKLKTRPCLSPYWILRVATSARALSSPLLKSQVIHQHKENKQRNEKPNDRHIPDFIRAQPPEGEIHRAQ